MLELDVGELGTVGGYHPAGDRGWLKDRGVAGDGFNFAGNGRCFRLAGAVVGPDMGL